MLKFKAGALLVATFIFQGVSIGVVIATAMGTVTGIAWLMNKAKLTKLRPPALLSQFAADVKNNVRYILKKKEAA